MQLHELKQKHRISKSWHVDAGRPSAACILSSPQMNVTRAPIPYCNERRNNLPFLQVDALVVQRNVAKWTSRDHVWPVYVQTSKVWEFTAHFLKILGINMPMVCKDQHSKPVISSCLQQAVNTGCQDLNLRKLVNGLRVMARTYAKCTGHFIWEARASVRSKQHRFQVQQYIKTIKSPVHFVHIQRYQKKNKNKIADLFNDTCGTACNLCPRNMKKKHQANSHMKYAALRPSFSCTARE